MYGLLDEKGARQLGRVERGRRSRLCRELIREEGTVEMSCLALRICFLFCEVAVEMWGFVDPVRLAIFQGLIA